MMETTKKNKKRKKRGRRWQRRRGSLEKREKYLSSEE